jgi:hypothetical protein
MHHRSCITQGAEILQEYYFLRGLQAYQLSLKSEKVGLWTVLIWHDWLPGTQFDSLSQVN